MGKLWDILYDGWELLKEGYEIEARRKFKEVLKYDSKYVDALNGLGNIAFDRGRLKEAEKYYRAAYRLTVEKLGDEFSKQVRWSIISNRQYLRAMHGLGLVLWRKGKPREALVIFEKILELNPDDQQGIRFLVSAIEKGQKWKDFVD